MPKRMSQDMSYGICKVLSCGALSNIEKHVADSACPHHSGRHPFFILPHSNFFPPLFAGPQLQL